MNIFGNAWVTDNAPWRHSTPNFDAIKSGGLEASGDILGYHLLQKSLSEYIAKISLWSKSLCKLNFLIIQ